MTKKSRNLGYESGVKETYGIDTIVFSQNIVHGGILERALAWIQKDGKEVSFNECLKDDDTDCVEVHFQGSIKKFYQGKWEEGKVGSKEDYHGYNAYVEAEKYGIGLL